MPRFITPPDVEFDKSIPKVLIRNCNWTGEQIQYLLNHLGDKNYDIYLYHDNLNDIQWFEGIRSMTNPKHVYDFKHHTHRDTLEWLKEIDNEF
jgi:hypothetical protein